MKILVCPWGDYARWEKVAYIMPDLNKYGKACTTLPIIADWFNPDRILIITLDSLAIRLFCEGRLTGNHNYEKLTNAIKADVKTFILGLDVEKFEGKVEVVIAPGIGRFKCSKTCSKHALKITGELSDYYYITLHRLAEELAENYKPGETLKVCLDLSHGINFMPTLTYKACIELLQLYAITSRVEVFVVNCEPINGRQLTIHFVEGSVEEGNKLYPSFTMPRVEDPSKAIKYKRHPELGHQIKEKLHKLGILKSDVNAFLSAVENGLPLAIYTFTPPHEELKELLQVVRGTWLENIDLSYTSDKPPTLTLERKLGLTRSFEAYTKAWQLSKLLNLQRKAEVSLEELDTLRERIFHNKNRVADCMISREINEIKNISRLTDSWKPLADYYPGKLGEFDPRNLFAHAGLEKNITEVKLQEDKTYLRYNPNRIEEVKKGLK